MTERHENLLGCNNEDLAQWDKGLENIDLRDTHNFMSINLPKSDYILILILSPLDLSLILCLPSFPIILITFPPHNLLVFLITYQFYTSIVKC